MTMAMHSDEYREAIRTLGYTQEGFAELLGAKPRTGQYWAGVSVPAPVETIIRLIQARPEILGVLESLAERRKASEGKRKR